MQQTPRRIEKNWHGKKADENMPDTEEEKEDRRYISYGSRALREGLGLNRFIWTRNEAKRALVSWSRLYF